MAKYNVFEIKEKKADYRSLISPQMMDKMQEQIMNIIVMQKKYRDKDYSAQKLANEIGTNTRYISAVVNTRFHMNYTQFVNSHRINEAMSILVDKRYQDLTMEEVSDMVIDLRALHPVNTVWITCRSILQWWQKESKLITENLF